eukprot:TRINITY_DN6569_c0_g1_i1.p1 TRINITY_DN6569_c0_g1~~TRINITY_DN6569_c0_g1_i1.p1  ORF type:complete len:384 (-),score=31.33 TRINITY_DN6569_c0_g1_i1:77-1228(-)
MASKEALALLPGEGRAGHAQIPSKLGVDGDSVLSEQLLSQLPTSVDLTQLAVFAACAPVATATALVMLPWNTPPMYQSRRPIKFEEHDIVWMGEANPTSQDLRSGVGQAELAESLRSHRGSSSYLRSSRGSLGASQGLDRSTDGAVFGRRTRKKRVADDFFDDSDEEYYEPAGNLRVRPHSDQEASAGHRTSASFDSSAHAQSGAFANKRIKIDPSLLSVLEEDAADDDGDGDSDSEPSDGSLQLKVKCNCRIRLPDDYIESAVQAIKDRTPISVVAYSSRDGVPLYPCIEDTRPKVAAKGHSSIFSNTKLELGEGGGVFLFAHVGCKGPCDARREEAALTKIRLSWENPNGQKIEWMSPKCKISCNRTTGKRRTGHSSSRRF